MLDIYRFERVRAGESRRIRKRLCSGTQFSAVVVAFASGHEFSLGSPPRPKQKPCPSCWGSRAWNQNFNSRIPVRVPRWLRARETKRDRATGEFGEKRERSYLSRLCLLSTRDNRRESLPGMLSRLSSAAAVLTGGSRWFRRVNRVNYADIQLALLAHMRVRLNFDRGESVFNLDRESASRCTSHHHHHREMRVRLPLSNFYSPRSRGLVSLARRIYAPP